MGITGLGTIIFLVGVILWLSYLEHEGFVFMGVGAGLLSISFLFGNRRIL